MSETDVPQEKTRRWSAYVCPDCRFVFRVPRDHDGQGIICSSCRRMLRIPQPGDATAPLMVPLKKIDFSEHEDDTKGEKKTRSKRKKKDKESELPEWDASSGSWRSNRDKKKEMLRTFAVWGGTMAAIVGLVALFMNLSKPEKSGGLPATMPGQDQFEDLVGNPLIIPDEELEDEVELPKVMEKSEAEFLAAAEPLARKFLEADHVDTILPLINNPGRVSPHVRDFYPAGKIKPTGISKFNATGQVSYKSTFAAVTILTPDYEKKQLAFIDGDDGLKIDWESWVGWSEVPWDKILEKRPTKPILVRTMAKWVDYYNFGFSDENAWRSYRLLSPDGETILYGYVERDSLLDRRLRPEEPGATVAVTLKIHFREGEQAPNQVVIDEYIADGWVVPKATK